MQPLDNLIHDLGIYLSIKLVFLFRSWHTWHGVTWFQRLAQPSPNQSLNPSHWIDLEMRNSGGLTCKSVQSVPVLWNLSVFSLLSLLTLKFWSLLQTSEPLVIKSTCIFALLGGPKIWNEENRNYGTRSCKADKLDSFFAFCRCLIWKLKHQNSPWSDITWYNDVMWHDMTWRYAVNQYAVAQLGGHRGSDRSPRGMLANSKGSTRVHGAELLLQVFGAEFHVAPAPTAHQATSSYALMTRMYRIPMHRWQNDIKIHIVERLVTQWDVAPCVMRLGPAMLYSH